VNLIVFPSFHYKTTFRGACANQTIKQLHVYDSGLVSAARYISPYSISIHSETDIRSLLTKTFSLNCQLPTKLLWQGSTIVDYRSARSPQIPSQMPFRRFITSTKPNSLIIFMCLCCYLRIYATFCILNLRGGGDL